MLHLYEQIATAGRLRTGELIDLAGHSRPRVLQYLYRLEARGLVRRVGAGPTDPRAYWTVEEDG
ncbi:MAG: MarR family transcriptional regulator [Spirochaetaceae bacterium]|nr:MarR family transcriptional regulator [Spirochaetaceae bacterium]